MRAVLFRLLVGMYALLLLLLLSCTDQYTLEPPREPDVDVYKIPVVVHIIHQGEPIGEGYNISDERILARYRL